MPVERPGTYDLSFLSVDEGQDNLLVDCYLFRLLCSNPLGFYVAGDTAQTIGSSTFRFQDLSALFWREEQADPLVKLNKRKAHQPESYTLALNYRSHRGILAVSNAITQAILQYWPHSIDRL